MDSFELICGCNITCKLAVFMGRKWEMKEITIALFTSWTSLR